MRPMISSIRANARDRPSHSGRTAYRGSRRFLLVVVLEHGHDLEDHLAQRRRVGCAEDAGERRVGRPFVGRARLQRFGSSASTSSSAGR
jgi:hypothetical protein